MSTRLTLPVDPRRDHLRGPADALVQMLEYGDYECPHCGEAHVVTQALLAQLGESVCFVYRNFPLTTIHPHAQSAAEAAEAAGAQGRFWDYHDLLFERQYALDDGSLLQYAAELELDLDRFTGDLVSRRLADRVREDFMSGVRSGVNGTPTFFFNGVRHDGTYAPESLLGAIQRAAAERRPRKEPPRPRA